MARAKLKSTANRLQHDPKHHEVLRTLLAENRKLRNQAANIVLEIDKLREQQKRFESSLAAGRRQDANRAFAYSRPSSQQSRIGR